MIHYTALGQKDVSTVKMMNWLNNKLLKLYIRLDNVCKFKIKEKKKRRAATTKQKGKKKKKFFYMACHFQRGI